MALDATKLNRAFAGASPGLLTYQTPDTGATVAASGYFNAVTNQLRQWDVIIGVCETGGTPKIETFVVTSATGAATVTTTTTEATAAT